MLQPVPQPFLALPLIREPSEELIKLRLLRLSSLPADSQLTQQPLGGEECEMQKAIEGEGKVVYYYSRFPQKPVSHTASHTTSAKAL
ncbi:hypothetical protein JOQ06_000161 [Pogonophryne albipinna]|uniref:Uncharacterized protein n=1 Tax=Pogonophryne albipinna TaxID=1090488 RepID=A0AAD6A5H6_9TELE|nr:hypothetical protein JOQ06_000161 [Pogonophryne albipinna]